MGIRSFVHVHASALVSLIALAPLIAPTEPAPAQALHDASGDTTRLEATSAGVSDTVPVPVLTATGPSVGPDVILSAVNGVIRWATLDGITAYSFGRTHCNIGDTDVLWQVSPSSLHPVMGMNMFKITADSTIEHIGQGWVMHGFCADQIDLFCAGDCPPGGGCLSVLQPGCASPNTAARGGGQGGLGPKWLIQPYGGFFQPLQPATYAPFSGPIARRLQVHNEDLDPRLNPGALYIAEVQDIARDDAEAGNQDNNVSHRFIAIGPAPSFDFDGFVSETIQQQPAIQAWQNHDPEVAIEIIDVPNDGQLWLAYKVTDNGDGTWHYEYALYNMHSHKGARAFTVPLAGGVTLTEIGFHDVDYHSGDGHDHVTQDGTDWAVTEAGDGITWSTSTIQEDLNANALRWGTMYNFRFDADAPPGPVTATIGLYRVGRPAFVEVPMLAPGACASDLDENGDVGFGDLLVLLTSWGKCLPTCAEDLDGDGAVGFGDLLVVLTTWGPCHATS